MIKNQPKKKCTIPGSDTSRHVVRLMIWSLLLALIFFIPLSARSQTYKDTLKVLDGSKLRLEWLKPLESDPIVRSYKIIFVDIELLDVVSFPITEWQELPTDQSYVYATINVFLPRYTDYELYLIAKNNAEINNGESPPSDKYMIQFVESESPNQPKEFVVIVIKKAGGN